MKELFGHLSILFWQNVLSIQSNLILHVDVLSFLQSTFNNDY